jgi:branched-chain amino acid transport system ATP-binding protein
MHLHVENLTMRFGGVVALDGVSVGLDQGEILGLIGPNGSGKSTLFNVVTGFYRASAGRVFLDEEDLTELYPHEITAWGLARTFQNLNLFNHMTVLENVMVGMHPRTSAGLRHFFYNLGRVAREERDIRERAHEMLGEMGLKEYSNEQAKNLPYGIQKRLEIARALASDPKFLLLDEPAAGLNLAETEMLQETIGQILKKGIAILLVEHNMRIVMNICPRICVLNYGAKIAEGTPSEISEDEAVVEAYLGKRKR